MPELFPTEVKEPPKKKKFYKAGDGKFTDKLTSRADQAEKQCKIHAQNEAFYKRQCERLQREIIEQSTRIKELEKQLGYGQKFERYNHNQSQ